MVCEDSIKVFMKKLEALVSLKDDTKVSCEIFCEWDACTRAPLWH